MKRMRLATALLVLVCLVIFSPSPSFSQTVKPGPTHNVTFNPLGLLVGGMGMMYNGAVANFMSIDIGIVYVAPMLIPAHVIGGELRFTFWTRRPHDGFFIGPFLQASRTFPADSLLTDSDGYLGVTAIAPGALIGYRWLWDSGFNVGLGAGFGWAFAVEQEDCPSGASCSVVGEGAVYRLLLDLGFAF
jgi:hypothetical protein